MTREEWRPVVGFEGLYEVSNLGRVRSLDRYVVCSNGAVKFLRSRILRPGPRPSGHLTVALTSGQTRNVHTLVLEAFVGPRPYPLAVGRHLDGNEKNNRLTNLEWSSRSRNGQDKKWHRRPRNYKLSPEDVIEIKRALAEPKTNKTALARQFGVNRITIQRINDGRAHIDVVLY